MFIFALTITILIQAQDDQAIPSQPITVAFVEGLRILDTASITNIGDDGLTRLAEQLLEFGAESISIDLSTPLSTDIDLVVIIRPRRLLTATQTAHLWEYLQAGGNLLLALDPNGHNRVRTETSRSGINQLLELEYGITIGDNMLIEPWFDVGPLSNVVNSWSDGTPDEVTPHPITQPLVDFDLPIRFWGGRSLNIEFINGVAETNALIYAENLYGETSRFNLNDTDTNQFELNIGTDVQGRLVIAGIAEKLDTGSRIAVIGDSEIFQNIYGLTRNPAIEQLPLFLGNALFVQRLLQWLLKVPEEQWVRIPEAFTQIVIDGQTDDWIDSPNRIFNDTVLDVDSLGYDIQSVQLFNTASFVYIAVETFANLNSNAVTILRFAVGNNSILIILDDQTVSVIDNESNRIIIPDASYAIADHLEVHLPLRIVSTTPLLTEVCISDVSSNIVDCYTDQMTSFLSESIETVTAKFEGLPMAFVLNSGNLRQAPFANSELIAGLSHRTQLAILGRDVTGDWVKVANGRYEGWIATVVIESNADIQQLPIIES